MKDPWVCPQCGGEMVKTSTHNLVCSKGHGRCYPAPQVDNLPLASRAFQQGRRFYFATRLFRIAGHQGVWKYIPYAHKTALDKRPGPGVVIAKVRFKGGRVEARAFRRAGK